MVSSVADELRWESPNLGRNAGLHQCRIVPRNLCSHDDASDPSCVNLRRRSGMKRLQMALRSTMSDERLPSLAVLHVHKHKEVISEFAGKKDRRLSLCL